jgi:hypothetical protein
MDETPRPDLDRLARHARTRRHDLGLPMTALAAKAGLSKDTYVRIEHGKRVSAGSYAKAEAALGWGVGTVRGVLGGGEPAVAQPAAVPIGIPPEVGEALAAAVVAVVGFLAGVAQGSTDATRTLNEGEAP